MLLSFVCPPDKALDSNRGARASTAPSARPRPDVDLRHQGGVCPGDAARDCPCRYSPPMFSSDRAAPRRAVGLHHLHCCHGRTLAPHHGGVSALGDHRAHPATCRDAARRPRGDHCAPGCACCHPVRRQRPTRHPNELPLLPDARRPPPAPEPGLRPSEMVTRYQQLEPSPPPSSMEPNDAMPSSRRTPSSSFCFSSLLRAPSTRTAYSRSSPKRGCMSLLASSPELVNSSRPSVFRSRRPTDCHLPCMSRGSLRKTVGRFWGSSWVTTSPTGLW